MTKPRVKRTSKPVRRVLKAATPAVHAKQEAKPIVQSEKDLVKHLASRDAGPLWILLAILIVTIPEALKNSWWLGPSIAASIAGPYYWMFMR